jgi:hypothetical protein
VTDPVFVKNEAGLYVGRWPKKVGEDTHDLTADPIDEDEDDDGA